MSKETISRKVAQEIERINEQIDRNIIAGRPYHKEAQRHRELLSVMRRVSIGKDTVRYIRRGSKVGKSPVRQSFRGSSFLRLVRFGV